MPAGNQSIGEPPPPARPLAQLVDLVPHPLLGDELPLIPVDRSKQSAGLDGLICVGISRVMQRRCRQFIKN
jgi:hypothetical protein